MSRLNLAFLILVLPMSGGDDPPRDDAKLLQGSWKAVKAQVGDREIFNQPSDRYVWLFEKDQIRTIRNGDAAPQPMVFKIDPKADPKTIDLFKEGGKEPRYRGIYEIEGKTLKIRYSAKERPKSFKADQPRQQPFDVVFEFQREEAGQ